MARDGETHEAIAARLTEAVAPFGLEVKRIPKGSPEGRYLYVGADLAGFAYLQAPRTNIFLIDTATIGLNRPLTVSFPASSSAGRMFDDITRALVARLRPRPQRTRGAAKVEHRDLLCMNKRAHGEVAVTMHARVRLAATTATWSCDECGYLLTVPRPLPRPPRSSEPASHRA